MELMLARDQLQTARTLGRLYLDGRFFCFTVEDVERVDPNPATPENEAKVAGETAIPIGLYRLKLEDSPKFGKETLTLCDVPGFTVIRIHAGNTEKDTEGCIIVGLQRTPTGVASSRDALKALRDELVPRLRSGEACHIRVLDVPPAR